MTGDELVDTVERVLADRLGDLLAPDVRRSTAAAVAAAVTAAEQPETPLPARRTDRSAARDVFARIQRGEYPGIHLGPGRRGRRGR